MIEKLKLQNKIDVYDFLERVKDSFEDFYITKDKERYFLKKNWLLIEKIVKYQEIYGLFDNGLQGILIILREKGYRPYIKLLATNRKYTIDLLKYLKWNFQEKELFAKFKKQNPLSQLILKTGFSKIGDRGSEDLFCKKGIKQLYKVTPKDDYLPQEENRLY